VLLASNSSHVLVVDDDADICSLVCRLLERAGFQAAGAFNGEEGLKKLFSLQPSLVVLDVGMPGMDGIQILERIRDVSDVPVLMLTAKGGELDKVRGLRAGADDYVTKPFGRQELLARVEALLRRRTRADGAPGIVSDPLVTIDFSQARVTADGKEVPLTPLEFRLLAAFVRHPNQVLSRDQLLELVWGPSGASPAQVKLYVGYLRRKLEQTADASPIETVRGFGYRYRPKPD
jgi:DNA-binding response OmpR family regulator